MNKEQWYIICQYCGKFTPLQSNHIDECKLNESNYDKDNDLILSCFSCGVNNGSYTKSQLAKKHLARCTNCVNMKNTEKHMSFEYESKYGYGHVNKYMEKAIEDMNYDKVKELLINGADPNYIRQHSYYCNENNKHYAIYDMNGAEIQEIIINNIQQPSTPLKLCIFKLSDCRLNDEDMKTLINIANLLLNYGANNEDAFRRIINKI